MKVYRILGLLESVGTSYLEYKSGGVELFLVFYGLFM